MTESQNIEYKESWKDDYLKWICGFANASGGRIYVGVRDDGTVVGVPNSKKLLEDIPNKIRDTMGLVADVNLLEKDGKKYIEIRVNPSSYPVSYHGEYHYRSGSTKQQLTGIACRTLSCAKPASAGKTSQWTISLWTIWMMRASKFFAVRLYAGSV